MSKIAISTESGLSSAASARHGGVRAWPGWAPYAAVAWSLVYAALGIYWAMGGSGFPFTPEYISDPLGPLVGRSGAGPVWFAVLMVGLPAAGLGFAMLRGVRGRVLRPLLIIAGSLLAGTLLLLMPGLDLLVHVGYIPYGIFSLVTGSGYGGVILQQWAQWVMIHQLLCLTGGFLWLGATVGYARLSKDSCAYCGRRDGHEGWTSPQRAAHWGRIAVYVSLVAPVFYAFTRYAWALGFPLGMTREYLRHGQETGVWTSGLFLATFGLLGSLLALGLVQRWGEVFPRWMFGLAGRPVPIALAVVPAAIAAVLLVVGGTGIWAALPQMAANLAASGVAGNALASGIFFQVGATLLFPVWGVSLAVATLGYYYRRRGPCKVCGRGASTGIPDPRSTPPLG